MKCLKGPDPVLIGMATVLGVAMAVGTLAMLSVASKPSRLDARMDVLEANIARTQVALARPGIRSHYLPDPICHTSAASAGDLVRAELGQAAQESGLAKPTITFAANADDLTSEPFPVMFTVEVTDRYDLVLGFLDRLAQREPEVFADSLDLTSKTSAVSLKLVGRVECLTNS
jgi:hypothetical protein